MSYTKKTPLPSKEVLGVPEYGFCHTISTLKTNCSCGRVLGAYEYEISKERARLNDPKNPINGARLFTEIANKYELNMCCRNLLLAQNTANVVLADKGSYYRNREDKSDFPKPEEGEKDDRESGGDREDKEDYYNF